MSLVYDFSPSFSLPSILLPPSFPLDAATNCFKARDTADSTDRPRLISLVLPVRSSCSSFSTFSVPRLSSPALIPCLLAGDPRNYEKEGGGKKDGRHDLSAEITNKAESNPCFLLTGCFFPANRFCVSFVTLLLRKSCSRDGRNPIW